MNYFFKDHLGSVRTVVDGSGNILEQSDYYPFGGRHKRNDYAFSDNNYRFNGKEEQSNYLGMPELGWTDFGARMYDTKLGRWFGVDPLAEKSFSWSPYVYCLNNPINRFDPDGRDSYYSNNGSFLSKDDKETDEIIIRQFDQYAIERNNSLKFGDKLPEYKDTRLMDMTLSAEAYSNIFTDVLSKMDGVNVGDLKNGKVSVTIMNEDDDTKYKSENTFNKPSHVVQGVQASMNNETATLSAILRPRQQREYFGTVSNVQNLLGLMSIWGIS